LTAGRIYFCTHPPPSPSPSTSPATRRGSESGLYFTAKSHHSGFWPRFFDQSSSRSQDMSARNYGIRSTRRPQEAIGRRVGGRRRRTARRGIAKKPRPLASGSSRRCAAPRLSGRSKRAGAPRPQHGLPRALRVRPHVGPISGHFNVLPYVIDAGIPKATPYRDALAWRRWIEF